MRIGVPNRYDLKINPFLQAENWGALLFQFMSYHIFGQRKNRTSTNNPNSKGNNSYRGPELANTKSKTFQGGEMERVRSQFLKQEASVKGIGGLFVFFGILTFIEGFTLSNPEITRLAGPVGERFGGGELLPEVAAANGRFVMFLGVLHIWIGWGLIKLRNCARITAGIFAIPNLLAIPIGTLLSGYIIYSLISKNGKYVCSLDYNKVIAETPKIKCQVQIRIIFIAVVFLIYKFYIFYRQILG